MLFALLALALIALVLAAPMIASAAEGLAPPQGSRPTATVAARSSSGCTTLVASVAPSSAPASSCAPA